MTQANIIISAYGNGIAVGLNGTREQIEKTFNRFFNWGATGQGELGSYLHELSDNFSYFLSTEADMLRAMTYETMTKWQDSPVSDQYKARPRFHKKPNGKKFRADAVQAARDEYESFSRESFMLYTKTPTHLYRELDGGAPSWIPEYETGNHSTKRPRSEYVALVKNVE
jgi:hypothetical protein